MTENRDTQPAGSPVEENEASETDVLAAVERARDAGGVELGDSNSPDDTSAGTRHDGSEPADAAATTVLPHYATGSAPTDASETASNNDSPVDAVSGSSSDIGVSDRLPNIVAEAHSANAETRIVEEVTVVEAVETVEPIQSEPRDGEVRISADHPMAALYMQTPMPPELRGNRLAGLLITLLGTVGFAVVYAGVISLRIAQNFPPSTFFTDGLMPFLVSWGFIAACASFFVGVLLLVLIFGRAGWWAYVLGGFFVAVLVWAATTVGYALSPEVLGLTRTSWELTSLVSDFGLTVPALGAALVAREATIWFGAWIGFRGRRISAKNAQLLADYDVAVAEARSKNTP